MPFGVLQRCCPAWLRPSRLVTTLLILLLFSGTMVLVALSVSLFSDIWRAQNKSQDAKDAYTSVVKSFNKANVYTWVPGTMSIGISNGAFSSSATSQADIVSIPVPIEGDTSGVERADSIVGQALLPIGVDSPNVLANFTVSLQNFTPPIVRYAQLTQLTSTGAICSPSNGLTCNETLMQHYCIVTFGSLAAYVGSSYCRAGGCGDCFYYSYLTDYCLVVDSLEEGTSGYRVVADPSWLSCHYPFTDDTIQTYSWSITPPTSLTVSVYKSDDPWIQLQLQTGGTCLFETEELGSTKVYLASSAVGAIVTFLLFIALYTYMRRNWGEGAAQGKPGRPTIPVTFGTSRSFIFSNGAVGEDDGDPTAVSSQSSRRHHEVGGPADYDNTTIGRGHVSRGMFSVKRMARRSGAGGNGSGLTTASFASSMASGYSVRGDSTYTSAAGPSTTFSHPQQKRHYNDISTYGREPATAIVGFGGHKHNALKKAGHGGGGGSETNRSVTSPSDSQLSADSYSDSIGRHSQREADKAPLLGAREED